MSRINILIALRSKGCCQWAELVSGQAKQWMTLSHLGGEEQRPKFQETISEPDQKEEGEKRGIELSMSSCPKLSAKNSGAVCVCVCKEKMHNFSAARVSGDPKCRCFILYIAFLCPSFVPFVPFNTQSFLQGALSGTHSTVPPYVLTISR